MQDLPDKGALLVGVARFLGQDLLPHVSDRGAAFRVRIAAHLLAMVARELASEGQADPAELRAFQELLGRGGEVPADPEVRAAEIAEHRSELAAAIRSGEVPPEAALDTLMQVLGARLAVSNPRFDTSLEHP